LVQEFRVEELAEAAGVAVDTVRYYQRQQLLASPRRAGRRAIYDSSHLDRLTEIRLLASKGFSLTQIRSLSTADASGLLADLAEQNAADPELDKAELARRAEVPEFIVDVVVSASLIAPSGEPGEERFPADAVDMLVAAKTLVNAGVSMEELTALALRHATHIEDVVDDAIGVFKRQSDRNGDDRDELIALMHRLVPVASSLVGQHFERTLRSRALARLGDDTPAADGGVVVFSRRLAERVDPVSVFMTATDGHRALWIRPELGQSIVGIGAVDTIEPYGENRFSAASAARAALGARVRRHGSADAPAPVLLGGFSFAIGSSEHGPDWTGFPDARWVLPEITFIDRADGSWIIAATRMAPGEDERIVLESLEARVDALAAAPASPVEATDVLQGEPIADDQLYVDLVASAVGDIRAGDLGKVVCARVQEREPIDVGITLQRLVPRYPTCAVFAFGVGDRTFLGASPEQLVLLDGPEVQTVALAGTTARGCDETADEALGAEMMASSKVRQEHQFVVADITQRLATLGLVGHTPEEPEVLRLARVQHLRTPITARVERRSGGVSDMDVLRVASVLHPTPAVAGTPTQDALDWLQDHEELDRGWYAAPVGWCDLDGNGELRVALRSALVDPDRVQLIAGAGIVADSVPEDELAETAVKLRALLDVMEM
jgi:salicylate biosynthesis isochorismate synthase